jgi:arylformamidase
MHVVDLTLPLFPGMPGQPGDPPVSVAAVRSHESDGYEVAQVCLGTHAGTHLDAPRHFFPEGATLDRYPVNRLVGPGVVVDCRPVPDGRASPTRPGPAQAEKTPLEPAGLGIIDASALAERLHPHPVPYGGFALLWTEGALLTVEAAQLLVDAGAILVGTDAPSLDTEPYPVHRLLLSHGVLLAENLCGFDLLGAGPVTCAFLPLAVADTDGAPVRAIAWRS